MPSIPKHDFRGMILGPRVESATFQSNTFIRSGGRPSLPTDFVRLAEGLYSFRKERLLEVWIEGGEAVVCDHGPEALKQALSSKSKLSAGREELRRRLGLGECAPLGKGVPLLC